MRIAITSRLYFPVVGGTPVLLRLLARAFAELGHEVTVITKTAADASVDDAGEPFTIHRQPDYRTQWEIAGWADVVFQIEVGLALAIPFLIRRKPCIVSHHTICGLQVGFHPVLWVQQQMTRLVTVTSVSESVRQSWGGHGQIIPNCYDDRVFTSSEEPRIRSLLFVGRLIPTKGIDIFLEALAILHAEGISPLTAFIGDDHARGKSVIPDYLKQVERLGIGSHVEFLGELPQEQVAREMRHSKVLVVPSTWHEPFGIVALEGLASGCILIATTHGGLRAAGAQFGHYFENGDVQGLAHLLRHVLQDKGKETTDVDALMAHLNAHTPTAIAHRYIALFEKAQRRNLCD